MREEVALVTGGSRGIGRAIVERLAATGHKVVSISRSDSDPSLPAECVTVDLSKRDEARAAIDDIVANYDVTKLVNNAGIDGGKPDALALDLFDAMVDINLRSCLVTTAAVLPAMKARKNGRIVNISSRSASGKAGFSIYSATKAGVLGMSRCLALELAGHGITVNVISPGPIDTELGRGGKKDLRGLHEFASKVPLGRIGQPDDVAGAAMFFLDDGASWITGQNLFVCGGLSVGVAPV